MSGRFSGYHDCPCRDCFDIAIGGEDAAEDEQPSLCHACKAAGCEACPDPEARPPRGVNYECQRADAYGVG